MSHLIAGFDPSALSGQFESGIAQDCGKLTLWNDSKYNLILSFGDSSEAYLPATTAQIFVVRHYSPLIYWRVDTVLNTAGEPISWVRGESYDRHEKVPGTYPTSIARQVTVGNPLLSTQVTRVQSLNETPDTTIIDAQPSTAPGSAISITNSGYMLIREYVGGAWRQFIETVRNAAAGGINLVLGHAGFITRMAGRVQVDETLSVTGTSSFTGAATFNDAVTLGNAAADAITIPGTSTFSAPATFNAAVTLNQAVSFTGNVTLGNGAVDTLTVVATSTYNNPVTFNDVVTYTNTATFNHHVTIGNAAGDVITVGGTSTFNAPASFTGNVTLGNAATDLLTIEAATTQNATETHNGAETHWGAETHHGIETHNGVATFNGNGVFNRDVTINAGWGLYVKSYIEALANADFYGDVQFGGASKSLVIHTIETHNGAETHHGVETHNGAETHNGVETHNDVETHNGEITNTNNVTFQRDVFFSGGWTATLDSLLTVNQPATFNSTETHNGAATHAGVATFTAAPIIQPSVLTAPTTTGLTLRSSSLTANDEIALNLVVGGIANTSAQIAGYRIGSNAAGIIFRTRGASTLNHVGRITDGGAWLIGRTSGLTGAGDLDVNGNFRVTGNFGAYGLTPVARPAAYTQTYATTSRTHAAYTPDAESAAYTGIASGVGGTPYAQLADLNALRVAYENLRAAVESEKAVLNQILDDLQANGLLA